MNNNDMIVDSLKEYVIDSKTSYAVLLTAPWGVGKTYFAKNILYDKLKEVTNKNIYYISLNGIKDINQISNGIFCNLKLLKGAATVTIDLFQMALSNTLPIFSNFNFDDIKENVKNYRNELNDCVLIFDDYERCECKQEELLGYINQLVEHNSCKVIIITNEEEIKEKEKYKTLQEKVIGYTLKFEGDFYNVLDSLNQIYLNDNEKLRKILTSNRDQILTVANKYKHYNLRTYIFFLSVIKRIYNICSEDELIKNLIGNVFEVSVTYKSKPQSDSDPDYDINVFYISNLQVNQLISNMVYNGITDIGNAKQVLNNYATEISQNCLPEDDPVNVLVHWDEYTNKDITDAMLKIQDKLNSLEYGSDACAKIILYTCHLLENGFNENECKSLCNSVCDYLENNNIVVDNEIDLPRFNMSDEISTFYNHYAERIKEINNNRKSNKLRYKLKTIIEADDWGIQLEDYILESKFIEDSNLFTYLDMGFLLSKIKECNQIQIKHFTMALDNRYSSSNFYEFYYSDLESLERLLKEVNNLLPDSNQVAVRYQLNKLKEKLKYYVKQIQDYNTRRLGKR